MQASTQPTLNVVVLEMISLEDICGIEALPLKPLKDTVVNIRQYVFRILGTA